MYTTQWRDQEPQVKFLVQIRIRQNNSDPNRSGSASFLDLVFPPLMVTLFPSLLLRIPEQRIDWLWGWYFLVMRFFSLHSSQLIYRAKFLCILGLYLGLSYRQSIGNHGECTGTVMPPFPPHTLYTQYSCVSVYLVQN